MSHAPVPLKQPPTIWKGQAMMTLRLPAELKEDLIASAARNERTLSQELRRAIRFYIAVQGQER